MSIPQLTSQPLETRITLGDTEAEAGDPTTPEQAAALARTLADRLGRPFLVATAPGITLAGRGDPTILGRTARRLAGVRGRIRDLLRMTETATISQLVMLEDSRDRFELADATLFGQAPLTTRTAVLGLAPASTSAAAPVEDRLVVLAWRDPDAASFLAATGRALATAAIVEGGLPRRRSTPPAAPGGGSPAETPDESRPPTWFLEGLASQLAASAVSPNALEPRQREAGLRFLRSGGDPRRIFALPPDDPQWIALDGVAQSVAFLAVQRLAEDAPANLDRLIGALRAGRSWPEAWRTSLGGTPASLAERLLRHHAVND